MDETAIAFELPHARAAATDDGRPLDRISVRDYTRQVEIGAFSRCGTRASPASVAVAAQTAATTTRTRWTWRMFPLPARHPGGRLRDPCFSGD